MTLIYAMLFLLLTYIWGSIPFGYLVTKFAAGKNILKEGSGNVGSTNVKRIAGPKMAIVTQLFDMLKGLLPVALFLIFNPTVTVPYYIFMLAFAAIVGHDFSLFLKFKGGKGVNTTLGASVLIAPFSVFISVALYFIVKWRFKYVSLGSIVLALSMPLIEWLIHSTTPAFYYLVICSVFIIFLHRTNIHRLIRGEELLS